MVRDKRRSQQRAWAKRRRAASTGASKRQKTARNTSLQEARSQETQAEVAARRSARNASLQQARSQETAPEQQQRRSARDASRGQRLLGDSLPLRATPDVLKEFLCRHKTKEEVGFARSQHSPSLSLHMSHLNCGCLRFDAYKEYDARSLGAEADIAGIAKQIRGESLTEAELSGVVTTFLTCHSHTEGDASALPPHMPGIYQARTITQAMLRRESWTA